MLRQKWLLVACIITRSLDLANVFPHSPCTNGHPLRVQLYL